jgi:hypothetical protein
MRFFATCSTALKVFSFIIIILIVLLLEQELMDNMQVAFQRSPQKSVRRASRELLIPKSTVHKVLHKRLHLQPYKVQLTQAFEPRDLPRRAEFAASMLDSIEQDQ